MICGKKNDPEQEDGYKEIVEMENDCKNIEKEIDEVGTELDGICRSLKLLQKRVKGTNEELQKLLETLDGVSLNEDQQECRIKRKSVASKLNKVMDRNDTNLAKITKLLEPGVP